MIDINELRIPKSAQAQALEVIGVTDAFCLEHLDDEYADLCRRLVAKLARKRPSPLVRGDLRIWAAGVVYALAQVNFLFDETQTPHVSPDRLSESLGVKKTTMGNKGRLIRDLLDLDVFDPEFSRQSMIASNPRVWMLELDGFLIDVRTMPLEIQQLAFDQGLIPYVPGEPETP